MNDEEYRWENGVQVAGPSLTEPPKKRPFPFVRVLIAGLVALAGVGMWIAVDPLGDTPTFQEHLVEIARPIMQDTACAEFHAVVVPTNRQVSASDLTTLEMFYTARGAQNVDASTIQVDDQWFFVAAMGVCSSSR